MAFDKVKSFFGVEEGESSISETEAEDSYYKVQKSEVPEDSMGSNKMILFEPRAYSESTQIVDLKRVTPDQAKRIVDFLTGSLYAMNGNLQKLGGGIFLCAPNNVNIQGKITEDKVAPSKGKSKDTQEDEFNW